MKQFFQYLIIIACCTMLVSCAVLFNGRNQEVLISSTPSGAAVTIDGVFKGNTPLTTELQRGQQHDILIQKSGYRPYRVKTKSVMSPASALCVYTMWIDLATAKGYDVAPSEINAMLLKPIGSKSAVDIRGGASNREAKQQSLPKTPKTKPQTKEDDSPQFVMPGSST